MDPLPTLVTARYRWSVGNHYRLKWGDPVVTVSRVCNGHRAIVHIGAFQWTDPR
jgi:hypothetical protein